MIPLTHRRDGGHMRMPAWTSDRTCPGSEYRRFETAMWAAYCAVLNPRMASTRKRKRPRWFVGNTAAA